MTRIEHPDLTATVTLALQIQALLKDADTAQWRRSRVISGDDDDPGIRSLGEHGDPTFDAASDPTRLRLRAAVMAAEDVLTRHYGELTEAGVKLQRALDQWNGGR